MHLEICHDTTRPKWKLRGKYWERQEFREQREHQKLNEISNKWIPANQRNIPETRHSIAPYELPDSSFRMSYINNNIQVQNMSYVESYCYILCHIEQTWNYLAQHEMNGEAISCMFSISISNITQNIRWKWIKHLQHYLELYMWVFHMLFTT